MKNFLIFYFVIKATVLAQVNLTVSGTVANQNNEPLQAEIKISQLVGDTWEYRAEGNSDSNGNFIIPVDNITSVTDAGLSSLNYILHGNALYSPFKSEVEIINYNLLGEEVSRQKIELNSGINKLKSNLGGLANGIYIRSIAVKEGTITQKIIKNGNQLSYGSAGNDRINVSSLEVNHLNKVLADSLYLMTIASAQGFLPDTIISAVSKDEPTDIDGINFKLCLDLLNVSLEFIVSGTNGSLEAANFEENKEGIQIKIKNKTTGEEYVAVSDASGLVNFTDVDISNPMFEMTFADTENPDKPYIDKFKIRTIGTYNLEEGGTANLVQNIETSDWLYEGQEIDVTNLQTFWGPDGDGWWVKALGDELQKITFDAGIMKDYQNQGKPLEIFLIEDEYVSNISQSFPDGIVRLSDETLWEYYNSKYAEQFNKNKVLYWMLSDKRQNNGEQVPQDRLNDMISVSEFAKYNLENSSLSAPYIKIEEVWRDQVTGNDISTNLNNQISFTYYADDMGNNMTPKDGFIWRGTTRYLYSTNVPTEHGEKIEELAQMEEDSNSSVASIGWDYTHGTNITLPTADLLVKYSYILDPAENKEAK